MTLRHKKTCRNELTLSSSTLMFRCKENFSFFRNFSTNETSIEDCTFLHCNAQEEHNIFVRLSSDITFHAIECGVTTCPSYDDSWHMWPSLIKWLLTIIVLRLMEIRYCSIVARGSLKPLAYHSLPKYLMQKIQKSWNKMEKNIFLLPKRSITRFWYIFNYFKNYTTF